jgi:large subunit ribosomal protein L25
MMDSSIPSFRTFAPHFSVFQPNPPAARLYQRKKKSPTVSTSGRLRENPIGAERDHQTHPMKSVSIEGTTRADFGKTATRTLRSQDLVPGVIYGGTDTVHFSAPKMAFRTLVYTPDFQLAEITVDGRTHRCIMKDLQFDVVTDELTHVDFLELVEDRKIVANLPIKYTGAAQGVKEGGRLELKMKTLKVRTLPKHLVEAIEVDITNLQLNGNMRVEDVKAPEMEIMNAARQPIASVVMTRALRQAESDAAAKEKEGKKK